MHGWVSALLGVWHVLYHGVTVHRQAPDTVRKQLRRAIAPNCSRRLCVGTLGADTASRWSTKPVASTTPRQDAFNHLGGRMSKVGKQPATSRHRSPLLSQTVSRHGNTVLPVARRIAPSSSARLGSSRILKRDYRRRSSTPMREIMRERQRTVQIRFVACATVPRDSAE